MMISKTLSGGIVSLLFAAAGQAAPVISLVPSADLGSLLVGQSFTLDVVLSGLPSGTQLELLAATVAFPAASFGTPDAFVAGAIVPNPLASNLDFLTISDPGLADISFQTNSALAVHQITANGVFATITLTAADLGTGQIALSFIDALAFNAADPNQPQPITIEDAPGLTFGVVIPEPSVGLSAILGLALLARRNRGAR